MFKINTRLIFLYKNIFCNFALLFIQNSRPMTYKELHHTISNIFLHNWGHLESWKSTASTR